MQKAIERLVDSFPGGAELKAPKALTPCVKADLSQGDLKPDYPARSVIGKILYITTVGRLD